MDKRATEEFIQAYIWVASHADQIRQGREKGDQTLEFLIFWVQNAGEQPHNFFWTNGLAITVNTIQHLYNFGPIDPTKEARIRPAMEQMYPDFYPAAV